MEYIVVALIFNLACVAHLYLWQFLQDKDIQQILRTMRNISQKILGKD